jgi:hypothetical protein
VSDSAKTFNFDGQSQPLRVGTDLQLRLEWAVVQLEEIECSRRVLEDPAFGKIAEQRIIDRQLLELEIQHVDEELQRICNCASDGQ